MSNLHEATLKNESGNISSNTYSLYDMVFPNPDSDVIGLCNTKNMFTQILNAPEEWKISNDIIIEALNRLLIRYQEAS